MRALFCYSTTFSTLTVAVAALLGLASSASAQVYAVGEPMIVACPDIYKGEMTVVETNQTQFPWQLVRWNCSGNKGLVSKYELESYLQSNPPAKTSSRRWEEKCPSGSVGNILFSSYEERRFVDAWTCSIDGSTKLPFDQLKRMLETKQTVEGAGGVTQQRTCPIPYQGTYSVVYRANKWDLQQWSCMAPGTKNRVNEATMRMLLPS